MKLDDDLVIVDEVSGLKILVEAGDELNLNYIHIEHICEPICGNRDFFFFKDGTLEGAGCSLKSK